MTPLSFQVCIDAARPHELADWWAETVGWDVEAQDADFIRRMIAEGHATEAETTTYRGELRWATAVALTPPSPGLPRVLFQAVPEPKTVKNRVHLDLRGVDDVDGFRTRLLERGATRLGEGREGPHSWVVFADPEGNEFCV